MYVQTIQDIICYFHNCSMCLVLQVDLYFVRNNCLLIMLIQVAHVTLGHQNIVLNVILVFHSNHAPKTFCNFADKTTHKPLEHIKWMQSEVFIFSVQSVFRVAACLTRFWYYTNCNVSCVVCWEKGSFEYSTKS